MSLYANLKRNIIVLKYQTSEISDDLNSTISIASSDFQKHEGQKNEFALRVCTASQSEFR